MIQQILGYIGAFSPIYMFLLTLFLLRHKRLYFSYYIFGTFANIILNIFLKLIIKEARPDKDQTLINIGNANGKRFGSDIYGMPSGHAQNCAFNFMYITLIFNSPWISCLYLVIGVITLVQRYMYNNHTILQLIIGIIVGLLVGYIVYNYTNNRIKGQLTQKKDDNGPL